LSGIGNRVTIFLYKIKEIKMEKMKKKKILTFVTDGESFLILRNNPADSKHGGDFWFTVTGEVEKGENDLTALKREVAEETNLTVKEIFPLNWGSCYTINDVVCEEKNYISFVNDKKIILNEEHIEYKWLTLPNFIKQIRWDADKSILQEVLEKGLKKELFFKQPMIE
jgi:8-oxo-dGTP pyrophosphatase MutT (NUDIX family)